MFYNKKNKKVYEKVCDDISYDMLDMSSEEGVDGSSAVSSDVSKGKSSAVLPVASADRAILCLLANTGRYAEEAGEAMKQLENESWFRFLLSCFCFINKIIFKLTI